MLYTQHKHSPSNDHCIIEYIVNRGYVLAAYDTYYQEKCANITTCVEVCFSCEYVQVSAGLKPRRASTVPEQVNLVCLVLKAIHLSTPYT